MVNSYNCDALLYSWQHGVRNFFICSFIFVNVVHTDIHVHIWMFFMCVFNQPSALYRDLSHLHISATIISVSPILGWKLHSLQILKQWQLVWLTGSQPGAVNGQCFCYTDAYWEAITDAEQITRLSGDGNFLRHGDTTLPEQLLPQRACVDGTFQPAPEWREWVC